MPNPVGSPLARSARVLVVALTATILVLAMALVVITIGRSSTISGSSERERVNALATSTDSCVTCHKQTILGIVEQYGHSTMAADLEKTSPEIKGMGDAPPRTLHFWKGLSLL